MSMYTTFKEWGQLLDYLNGVDYPMCFTVNYLPKTDEYALWIGNQPYYDYEQLIELEQQEKQWLYGKFNQISDIIERGRNEFRRKENYR